MGLNRVSFKSGSKNVKFDYNSSYKDKIKKGILQITNNGTVRLSSNSKENIDKILHFPDRHRRKKLLYAGPYEMQRRTVRTFELRKIFNAAAALHIIVVHRHKFQEPLPFFERTRKFIGKFIRRQIFVFLQNRRQIDIPKVIFPLQKGKKYLFLRLKIIIDRCARKRCRFSYIFQRKIFETRVFIQARAGINNFVSSCFCLLLGNFRHGSPHKYIGFQYYYNFLPAMRQLFCVREGDFRA